MNSGVVVLGMHRSGTSLLIGLLESFGYSLGQVSSKTSLLKPTATKENIVFRNINNQILSFNNSSWDKPPNKQLQTNAKIDQDMKHFCLNLKSMKWGIKDPRMLLTYTTWQSRLPSHNLVGTIRNPLSVALSLQKKNNLPLEKGLNLWNSYNRKLFEIWQQNKFPLLSFDDSREHYFSRLNALKDTLAINPNQALFNQFYHDTSSIEDCKKEISLPKPIGQLYEKLLKLTEIQLP